MYLDHPVIKGIFPLKKTRVLSKTILFGLSFTLLLAHSVSGQPGHSDKHGGELVFSTTSDPKSFNDIIAKETSTTLVTSHIFEGLTTTNAFTTKVEPHLAERWDVSEDGLRWTFYLRKDVLWNDGQPFTADDVVFTFNDLIYNPDIPSSARDIFTLDGREFKVEKIDGYTVTFELLVKFAPFLRGMGQGIMPKHKLKAIVDKGDFNFTWGIDTPPREIVGTGPYMLVRYDPGQRLVFERNPNYWKRAPSGERCRGRVSRASRPVPGAAPARAYRVHSSPGRDSIEASARARRGPWSGHSLAGQFQDRSERPRHWRKPTGCPPVAPQPGCRPLKWQARY